MHLKKLSIAEPQAGNCHRAEGAGAVKRKQLTGVQCSMRSLQVTSIAKMHSRS